MELLGSVITWPLILDVAAAGTCNRIEIKKRILIFGIVFLSGANGKKRQ